MEGLLKSVREEAWDGLIPAEFSMDSAEVTALQRPLPLYVSSKVQCWKHDTDEIESLLGAAKE